MRTYLLIQGLLALLYLNNVNGKNKPEQDEVDRLAVQQTGCKFLALDAGKSVSYTLNSSSFQHIALASVGEGVSPDKFELRFAVRSDEDFKVNLFSKNRFISNPKDPDYKFEFGANKNEFTKITVFRVFRLRTKPVKRAFQQTYMPKTLSADKYAKFYFTLDKDRLKLGPACEHFPVYKNYGTFNRDIVQLDFLSDSKRGAKILYDCPITYADCKCKA